MARPTKYKPLILKRAKKYLKEYEKGGEMMPTIEGLAVFLEITRETIYAWSKDKTKEEFSYIIKGLLDLQGKRLIAGLLQRDLNSPIVKLILSKHGYREESKQEHTIDPELQKLIEKANKILPE